MTHRESALQSRPSQLIRGRWRQLSVLLAILALGGCDFSRVEVSCLEHIPSRRYRALYRSGQRHRAGPTNSTSVVSLRCGAALHRAWLRRIAAADDMGLKLMVI
jgi:hypothetical protein